MTGFSQSLDEPHFYLQCSHCPDCSSLTKTLQLPSSLPLPLSSSFLPPPFPFPCPSTSYSPRLFLPLNFPIYFMATCAASILTYIATRFPCSSSLCCFFPFYFFFIFVSSDNFSKRFNVPSTSLCPPRASLSLSSLP